MRTDAWNLIRPYFTYTWARATQDPKGWTKIGTRLQLGSRPGTKSQKGGSRLCKAPKENAQAARMPSCPSDNLRTGPQGDLHAETRLYQGIRMTSRHSKLALLYPRCGGPWKETKVGVAHGHG